MKGFIAKRTIVTDEFSSETNQIQLGEWNGKSVAVKTGLHLRREIDILKKIGCHPNIVEFVAEIDEPSNYGAMTYVMSSGGDGSTLENLCSCYTAEPFSVKTCINMMRQLALGLSHLHSLGIIHHDLKDKNILVQKNEGSNGDPDGDSYILRICDFGLSELTDEKGHGDYERRSYGTGYYRAPEQLCKSSSVLPLGPPITTKIDIYAYGILCNQIMMAGRRSHDVLKSCPMILCLMTQKCMKDNPDERPDINGIINLLDHPGLENSPVCSDFQ